MSDKYVFKYVVWHLGSIKGLHAVLNDLLLDVEKEYPDADVIINSFQQSVIADNVLVTVLFWVCVEETK